MSLPLVPGPQKARQIAATARVIATVALVFIAIHIALRAGFPIGNALFNDATASDSLVQDLALILVPLLPAALFYEAVDQLRRALSIYRGGEFFSAAATSRVALAGDYAVAAMIAIVLIIPNVTLWISRRSGFDIRIEPELIGMLAFALFISLVGRVLAAASDLKAENDSFV